MTRSSVALVGAVLILGVPAPRPTWAFDPVAPSTSIAVQRQSARQQFVTDARQLATSANAEQVEAWLLPYHSRRNAVLLPGIVTDDATAIPTWDDPTAQQAWEGLRQRHATEMLRLAELSRDAPALAAELALEAWREAPQDASALRLVRRWLPAYPDRRRPLNVRAGTLRDPEMGWLPGKYWRVTSAHYHLLTNAGAAAGEQMVRVLENLRALAQPLLFAATSTATTASRRTVPHRVVLFVDRAQYTAHLQPRLPQIDVTVGYYDPPRRTSYFFVGDEAAHTTVLHEATHQLLQENWRPQHAVAESSDFWLVEGIAMYMESCVFGPEYACLGGADAERLQFARYRALRQRHCLPIAELASLGRAPFQQHNDLRQLYSQAAGLTHFLMDGADGAHRDRLLRYLLAMYRDERPALRALCDASWTTDDLDREYLEFLNVTDQDLESLLPQSSHQLCLGDTRVSVAGLAIAARYRELEWLDVAGLPADDAFVEALGDQPRLRQLNLEKSDVTERCLEKIGTWSQLEELDLSQTALQESDLAPIARLRKLKILWLTGTGVTDQCVASLAQLRELELLDLHGTAVTAAGRAQLRASLPRAKID